MQGSPRGFWLSLVGATLGVCLLVGIVFVATLPSKPATPEVPPANPSAPTDGVPRSPRLTLEDVAPVVTAEPQLAWVLERASPGWSSVDVPSAPAPDPARVERGRTLARELCAACHGENGRGDGSFAAALARRPRDLTTALRTRDTSGRVGEAEVFRTLSAGALHYGMPSFAHRTAEERWDLAAWVLSLQPEGEPGSALDVPSRPDEPDLHLGQDVYANHCASCHGAAGDGRGPLAASLKDDDGRPSPPTAFVLGPAALRGGARIEDIARVTRHGRPGTPMAAVNLPPGQLWAVAAYVARLTELGQARRRRDWNQHFAARGAPEDVVPGAFVDDGERRWSKRLSSRYASSPEGEAGCLACHGGIEPIAEGAMAEAVSAFAGGDANRACAVCHEGDPNTPHKDAAHAGMVGNPGSLWVTSVGAGCAKCHSGRGSLTTLLGEQLPEAVGGRLMHTRSRFSDPTGRSSGDYTYRLQRSLMAQETGKVLLVTSSTGLVDPSEPAYTDFPLCDPDGAEPRVGSDDYLDWLREALESGYVQRLERTRGVPTFAEAVELGGGNRALAAVVDYGRKACFRCHLWGEGQPSRAERRSSGCSACHVLASDRGWSESGDPTIPPRRPGHALTHELVTTPPDEQCARCHTRNPLTEHSEAHQRAGIGCVDCHTSIDVHGDGNAYPHMEHQVEVRCEDCHGSSGAPPWELPLGHGTPVVGKGPRGVHEQNGQEHLLTSRGNPRSNWTRRGERAVVISFRTGRAHVAPLLGARDDERRPECSAGVPGHEQVSCSLCHNRKGPRCTTCHMTYVPYEAEQDWLLSAQFSDPLTTRQQNVQTPGKVQFVDGNTGGVDVPFGAPDTRRDRADRYVPREHGCEVRSDYLHPDGKLETFVPRFNPGSASHPPVVANSLPHENAIPARTCKECHPDGEGTPAKLFGDVQRDRGDWWRREAPDASSQAARSRWRK